MSEQPNWYQGYVPPAEEWNSWWARKVDNTDATIAGGPFVPLAGGIMLGPLVLAGDPVQPLQAVTKQYADALFTDTVQRSGDTMTGGLYLVGDPTNGLQAATKQYADRMLPLVGGILSGPLFLAGDPTDPLGAATKRYVDNYPYLLRAGGTMTGLLTLSGDPTSPLQAATRRYVDSVASQIYNPKGSWNASTNTPVLSNNGGGGIKGDVYTVTTAGTTSLDGVSTWAVGDQVQNSGIAWFKIAFSTSFGTMAFQQASAVAITGGTAVLSALSVANDAWGVFDPRISGYSYGWFDTTGAMAGGINYAGTLLWSTTSFNTATIGTLTATVANLTTLNFGGALNVSQLTAAQLSVAGSIWATSDPRLPNLAYLWSDPNGLVAAAIDNQGQFLASLMNVSTSLTLSFDATQPNHALRKSYADTAYIPTTGGTVTGTLLLPSTQPSDPNSAASKAYVDASAASGGGGGLAGLTAQKDYPYPPLRDPKRDYGAVGDGVADDTSAVMACFNAAYAAGERLVAINDVFNVPNLLFTVCDIIPVGSGRLITHPMGPNIWVAPPFAPTPPRRINSTFHMPVHAPHTTALLRAGTPVVAVLTGESTAAPAPNGFTPLANTWGRLPPAFNAANPGKNIIWYNRAIGGQRWSDLNTVVNNPDTTVGWYTDTSRPWLNYIQDLAPDIVFIEFAGNDGAAFNINNMLSVIAKLKAFPKPPDIAVVTSNPYAQHYSTRGGFNGFENQCSTAMMEKSWFVTHGMGVVDSFRTSVIGNRGIDLDDLPILKDTVVTGGDVAARKMISLPFTWPTRCWGYGGIFYVNVNSWTALGGEIQFPLGAHQNGANAGSLLRVGRDSATGNLYYSVDVCRTAAGATTDINFIPRTVVSNWPCGTGDMGFFLSIVGSKLVLQSSNQNSDPTVDQYMTAFIGDIPRFAMPFQPVITCTAGVVNNALYFEKAGDGYATALSANPHPRTMYMPLLTDMEDHGNQGGIQLPWGGFGVGHDSVFKGIYARASCIDSCNFSAGA